MSICRTAMLPRVSEIHPRFIRSPTPPLLPPWSKSLEWMDVHTAIQLVSLPPAASPICSPHRSQRDPLTGLIASCSLSNGFPLHWGNSRTPYPELSVLQNLSPTPSLARRYLAWETRNPTVCQASCPPLPALTRAVAPFLSALPLLSPSHSRCHSLHLELTCPHSPCYLGFFLFALKISAKTPSSGCQGIA